MPSCQNGALRIELEQCPTGVGPNPLLTLSIDTVQLWKAPADQASSEVSRLARLLSSDEVERANRFRFEKDRKRFVIARGLLRSFLGAYLAADPAEIAFEYSLKGKPTLAASFATRDLHFNLSHSGAMVLFGFVLGRRLGVDVEEIRTNFDTDVIATRFFSTCEQEQLRMLPLDSRAVAFFRCWTRKEAYIKATGDGLSLPLGQFDVALRADHPAALLNTRPDAGEAKHWSLENVDVGPGYAAAVAVECSVGECCTAGRGGGDRSK